MGSAPIWHKYPGLKQIARCNAEHRWSNIAFFPLVSCLEFTGHFDVLVQDCSVSIANALEKLQSCTKPSTLRWRHDGHDGVSNRQPHHCLLNRLFGWRSKKTSKFRVTGLCAGNSPGTGEFPAQMASNAENVSTWWRHHDLSFYQLRSGEQASILGQG